MIKKYNWHGKELDINTVKYDNYFSAYVCANFEGQVFFGYCSPLLVEEENQIIKNVIENLENNIKNYSDGIILKEVEEESATYISMEKTKQSVATSLLKMINR